LVSRDQKCSLKNKLNEVKPIWRKVGVLRDKLIVHRDSSISISAVFKDANVSLKELGILALTYGRILDELIRAYGKAFNANNYSPRLFKEIEELMNDLLN
jgi:hypothetical protein